MKSYVFTIYPKPAEGETEATPQTRRIRTDRPDMVADLILKGNYAKVEYTEEQDETPETPV